MIGFMFIHLPKVMLYAKDTIDIVVEKQWLEQPPLVTNILRQSRKALLTSINNACLSLLEPLLVIQFKVPLNVPDLKTLGSIPAKATSFLGGLNQSISTFSDLEFQAQAIMVNMIVLQKILAL